MIKSRFLQLALFVLSFYTTNVVSQESIEIYSRVKIFTPTTDSHQLLHQLPLPLDCGAHHHKNHNYVVGELSASELALVESAGLSYEVLIEDMTTFYKKRIAQDPLVTGEATLKDNLDDLYCSMPDIEIPDNFELGTYGGGFLSYEEMLGHLDNMFTLYPYLITAKSPISETNLTEEGREIYWVKISDNPNLDENDEVEVLYTALHHAREPLSMVQMIFYMYYILENYQTNTDVRNLVKSTEMYFVPCINPDGYIYNETNEPDGGGMWRKNRFPNEDGTVGVDLNRNYGYNWGYDNEGSSPNAGSNVYRGTAPFSEVETQNIRDFCNAHEFSIAFNYHTFSDLLIHPWGYEYSLLTDEDDVFKEHARRMTWHNRYKYGTADQTVAYIVNGSSDDWMYGEQEEKPKIYAYTPEVGSFNDGFWPEPSQILPLAIENVTANIQAAYLASNYGVVNDKSLSFVENTSGTLDFGIQRLGLIDTGTFTVTVVPLTTNIDIVDGNTFTFTDMDILEEQTASFNYQLSDNVVAGNEFSYALQIFNGNYIISTNYFTKTYEPNLVTIDNVELDGPNGWNGDWQITNTDYFSADYSYTDSPFGNYANDAYTVLDLSEPVNLLEAENAVLNFRAKWFTEAHYDFVQILGSTTGDAWESLCGLYSKPGSAFQFEGLPVWDGIQSSWVLEEVDLSSLVGNETVYLRFVLVSDGWVTEDGFYVDDLTISQWTNGVKFKTALMLEGCYNTTNNNMNTNLQDANLIPLNQAFSGSPWFYNGNEGFNSLADIPSNMVDWVLLQVRSAADNYVVLEEKAGILLNDGTITDTEGNTVKFGSIERNQAYFVSVHARNHLAVMSSEAILLPNTETYNFTASPAQVFAGEGQLSEITDGVYALHTGDFDNDGLVTVNDFNTYLTVAGAINTYTVGDANVDGNVTVGDYNHYLQNASIIGVEQIRY